MAPRKRKKDSPKIAKVKEQLVVLVDKQFDLAKRDALKELDRASIALDVEDWSYEVAGTVGGSKRFDDLCDELEELLEEQEEKAL